MTSRKDFLRLAGLAAGALLVSCGDDEIELGAPRASAAERDVRILNSALDFEFTAVAAYTAGLELLRGAARRSGLEVLGHERQHAARLQRAIRDLGGTPNRPRRDEEYARQFPNLRSARDVLRFGVDLENAVIEAYVDTIPRLSSPDLRQAAAAIVASEAEHAALLLGLLNPGDPLAQAPQAFVTGVASTS